MKTKDSCIKHCELSGCHGHGVFDVAVRRWTHFGHSHGHVEDSMTVAPTTEIRSQKLIRQLRWRRQPQRLKRAFFMLHSRSPQYARHPDPLLCTTARLR